MAPACGAVASTARVTRASPEWQNGDYQTQPYGLKTAAQTLYFMGSNPAIQARELPTLEKADTVLDSEILPTEPWR